MDPVTVDDEYWVLHNYMPAGPEAKLGFQASDFSTEQIKNLNVTDLPLCRGHDSLVIGSHILDMEIETPQGNGRVGLGYIDARNPVNMMVIGEVQREELSEVSLAHLPMAEALPDGAGVALGRALTEVSLVPKGLRKGSKILAHCWGKDLKSVLSRYIPYRSDLPPVLLKSLGYQSSPSQEMQSTLVVPPPAGQPTPAALPNSPPPPAAPGSPPQASGVPAQQSAQGTPATSPNQIPARFQLGNDVVTKETLSAMSPEALRDLVMVLGHQAQNNQDLEEFAKSQAGQIIEELKRRSYEVAKQQQGEDKAKEFAERLSKIYSTKTLGELQNEGKYVFEVIACAETAIQNHAKAEQELQALKAASQSYGATNGIKMEDPNHTLLQRLSSYGNNRAIHSVPLAPQSRFNPYGVQDAEKGQWKTVQEPQGHQMQVDPRTLPQNQGVPLQQQQQPAVAQQQAPQQPQPLNVQLPAPGTPLYEDAMRNPAAFLQMQQMTQGNSNALLERLSAIGRGNVAPATTPQPAQPVSAGPMMPFGVQLINKK